MIAERKEHRASERSGTDRYIKAQDYCCNTTQHKRTTDNATQYNQTPSFREKEKVGRPPGPGWLPRREEKFFLPNVRQSGSVSVRFGSVRFGSVRFGSVRVLLVFLGCVGLLRIIR